jgi:hypothetical protein
MVLGQRVGRIDGDNAPPQLESSPTVVSLSPQDRVSSEHRACRRTSDLAADLRSQKLPIYQTQISKEYNLVGIVLRSKLLSIAQHTSIFDVCSYLARRL